MGAFHDAISPADSNHELAAVLAVAKVLNGFD
jgi:hypothetical protein